MKLFSIFTLVVALATLDVPAVFADTAPALVLKYDFERADSAANWRQDLGKDAAPDKIFVDATVAHSGQSALKFEIAKDAEKPRHVYTGAKLPAEQDGEGRSARLRLFARTSGVGAGEASVRILERDSTKVLGWLEKKETLLPLESSADWKEYEVTGKLSPSARGITLFVILKNPRAGQTIWLDDVSLELLQP
jgi:hypothetical protein